MNISKVVALLVTFLFSSFASADWVATVEDDIFTGKKKATLAGMITVNHMLAFDCAPQLLTLSLLERARHLEGEDFSRADLHLVVKVDQGKIHEFEARAGRRNESYIQMGTVEREKILDLLKEVRNAQSRIQVGLHERLSDSKWSATASVRGSTR